MRLKLLIAFALFAVTFGVNAQDEIFWSSSSANGEWDWGSGCTESAGGNWWWNTSGSGARQRPDCYASFNLIKFNNAVNTTMNLNSGSDFSANQILFLNGTTDRTINTNASRSIYFQNNNGNCKIENYVVITTHTFNVPIFVNSGGNNMEINPVNGYLLFNNTIRNNSDNSINIYGAQQVTFSGDIAGTPGVTINNTATVVYAGTSKTYSGTTTINTGTKLKISSNQTLGNIALNGGTLQVDAGATLTITGAYSSIAGSIIDNKGTIKLAGGSVTFPGNATVNNGSSNALSSLEAASSGTVTLNSILNVTGAIAVSAGTLALGGGDLHLNNAPLSIATGATFDNVGENQIINEGGTPTIIITGTFITRDKDGFVGTNSAIPNIVPTLNSGSTIEYGLNGDQAVQGSIIPAYLNVIFSGSGTKTLESAIDVTGTISVKDSAIFDAGNHSFGGTGTKLTMTGTSEFKTAGTGVKPDAGGTYLLGIGTKITFTNIAGTLESIRLAPIYYNIDIIGSSVGTDTATGAIDFQSGGTLKVKSTGTFKLSNATGFSGGSQTAISNVNNPTITLEAASTIEYAGANQTITVLPFTNPFSMAQTTTYSNLKISGTGDKKLPSVEVLVNNDIEVVKKSITEYTYLKIEADKLLTVANKITAPTDEFDEYIVIYNNGSLVQINDGITDDGNINLERSSTTIVNTDYTYWSSPVSPFSLDDLSPDTLDGMLYSFDSTINPDGDWKQELSSKNMDAGIGYIVRGPEPTGLPVGPAPYLATFAGKPNNGAYSISPIDANKLYLLGNPYPSALDADTFLTDNASVLDGTLYFWTHNTDIQDRNNITTIDPVTGLTTAGSGAYAYTSDDYAVYNIIGGTESAPSDPLSPNGKKPTGKIASGQGFFASSIGGISNTSKIIFNNSMRVRSTASNSLFFKTRSPQTKTAAIEKHRIWLNLTNSQGAFKQILIGYITDATNEYDSRFDGESFDANEFADFYSVNQDKHLVIQGRALPFDENDEVPLGYRSAIEGTFTINIDQVDGVLTNQAVYIEDKLTNTVFNLKTGNYTFNTVAGTFNDRFILRYTNKTLSNKDFETLENQVLVSNKNKQIKVNSRVETIDKVAVYDLLGRQLFKKEKVNSNELTIPNLVFSQQTVLVKVSLQNGQTVTKKIIF